MLRNYEYGKQSIVCGKSRLENDVGEAEPERKNDTGNTNSPVTKTQECCRVL